MTAYTSRINTLIDILFDHYINKSQPNPYYKVHVMNDAGREVALYEAAKQIESAFDIPGIDKIEFCFSQEYNDEGGTYLSTNIEITCSYYSESDKKEVQKTIPLYSNDDLDFGEEFNKTLTEEQQEALGDLYSIAEDLTQSDIDRTAFYDKPFTKENNPLTRFKEENKEASAIFEKYLLEQQLPNKTSRKSNKM